MVPTSRTTSTAILLSGLLLLTSCGNNGDPPPEPASSETSAAATSLGEPETVTENLDAPWSIAFYNGTPLGPPPSFGPVAVRVVGFRLMGALPSVVDGCEVAER